MNAEFSSIKELKNRMMPALNIRVKQLRSDNIYLTENDLWDYFVKIWKNCHDLTLADLVDDVLNKKIRQDEM